METGRRLKVADDVTKATVKRYILREKKKKKWLTSRPGNHLGVQTSLGAGTYIQSGTVAPPGCEAQEWAHFPECRCAKCDSPAHTGPEGGS